MIRVVIVVSGYTEMRAARIFLGCLLLLCLFALHAVSPPYILAQDLADWNEPRAISSLDSFAQSPIITTDSSGTVHVFWVSHPNDKEYTVAAIAYSKLEDDLWSPPIEIILSPDGHDVKFPRAVVDDTGRIHLFWSAPEQQYYGTLYHSWAPVKNAGEAGQWQPAQPIAENTRQIDGGIDSDGRLHVLYSDVLGSEGICHIFSADNGDTWNNSSCIHRMYNVREDEQEARPRLAIDSQDNLHAVWVIEDHSPDSALAYSGRAIYYAHTQGEEMIWTKPTVVDEIDGRYPNYDQAEDGFQPEWGNIVVDYSDRIHIVWVGRPDMLRYHQWSEDGGLSWSPRRVAIASGGYNNWQGLAVDDANRLHMTWPSLNGLEYSWWGEGKRGAVQLVSSIGNPHNSQAVVSSGNQLHTVWQDNGGDLRGGAEGLIYWSWLETSAVQRSAEQVPVAATPERVAATLPQEESPTATPATMPSHSVTYSSEMPSPVSPIAAILLAAAPATILIGVVLLLRSRRR